MRAERKSIITPISTLYNSSNQKRSSEQMIHQSLTDVDGCGHQQRSTAGFTPVSHEQECDAIMGTNTGHKSFKDLK